MRTRKRTGAIDERQYSVAQLHHLALRPDEGEHAVLLPLSLVCIKCKLCDRICEHKLTTRLVLWRAYETAECGVQHVRLLIFEMLQRYIQ